MADQCLFDFLHMEIVSHVYKKQQPNNGEVDNKVSIILLCTCIVQSFYKTSVNTSKSATGTIDMRDVDTAYC